MEALVDSIFEHLRHGGSVLANRRCPGVAGSHVQLSIRALGLEPAEDLVRLYSCCDGTTTIHGDTLDAIQFFPPGFHWMKLGASIETYHSMSLSLQWHKSWFPVFANGGGDFYAVVCDQSSPCHGEVVGFIRGEPEHLAEFKSISSMLEIIERCFVEGAFFVENGRLNADYSQRQAIVHQLQPAFEEHVI